MLRLTRAQVREIDRRAIEEYHIPGIVLMENAARAVADAAWEMVDRRAAASITILCGSGNNGGDGLAAARHLHNRGASVEIFLVTPDLRGDAAINLAIAGAMLLLEIRNPWPPTLVIDAIFGTGLNRAPTGNAAEQVNLINSSGSKILAVDLPSGLDCDTGQPLGACVKATKTITFVAEKAGFANPTSKQYTGEITVGDIGCPRELIEQVAKMQLK